MKNFNSQPSVCTPKKPIFRTKSLILSAILIAVGFVLHSVSPPIFFGIKPDFLLACMFLAIAVNPHLKNVFATGIVAGFIAALTTGFPGGQIPSVLDKILSALAVYYLLILMTDRLTLTKQTIFFALITWIGTIISGTIFLGSAFVIAGLPAPFLHLMAGIVLPTAIANSFFGALIYRLKDKFVSDQPFRKTLRSK